MGESWGDHWGSWRDLGGGRRVAILFMGSEGWAACSSGCISSVSLRSVSPLLSIIELSSRPLFIILCRLTENAVSHHQQASDLAAGRSTSKSGLWQP